MAAGRGAREGGRPGDTLQGRHLRGGILAFSLQCVNISLYLFSIYSVH